MLGGVTKEIEGPRFSTLVLSSFATHFLFDHVFFCCTLQLIIMTRSVIASIL